MGSGLLLAAMMMVGATPCDEIPASLRVLNPTILYVNLPDLDAVADDGGPMIDGVLYALFPDGTTAYTAQPVQGPSTVPRSAFRKVDGICYEADLPAPIPTSAWLVAALKGYRLARGDWPADEGDWSDPSNPFLAARPRRPDRPGQPKAQRQP